jgi:hypothetical protein
MHLFLLLLLALLLGDYAVQALDKGGCEDVAAWLVVAKCVCIRSNPFNDCEANRDAGPASLVVLLGVADGFVSDTETEESEALYGRKYKRL